MPFVSHTALACPYLYGMHTFLGTYRYGMHAFLSHTVLACPYFSDMHVVLGTYCYGMHAFLIAYRFGMSIPMPYL